MSVRSSNLLEYSENGVQRGQTPMKLPVILHFLVDKLILHDIII